MNLMRLSMGVWIMMCVFALTLSSTLQRQAHRRRSVGGCSGEGRRAAEGMRPVPGHCHPAGGGRAQ